MAERKNNKHTKPGGQASSPPLSFSFLLFSYSLIIFLSFSNTFDPNCLNHQMVQPQILLFIFTNYIHFCPFHSFPQTILMLLLYRQLLSFYPLMLHEVVTNIKVKDVALKQGELHCIPMLTFKCIQMRFYFFLIYLFCTHV